MSEKKHTKHSPDEALEPSADAAAEQDAAANDELATLMKRLEETEAKVAEHLDGWQRSQAEFINYKNRVQRDQEAMKALMKGDIIRKFLPVLDDLERALKNRPSDGSSGEAWAGIELIVRKLHAILESEGVTQIEAEGRPFDPTLHEAISHEPLEGVESGHVIAVVQNGYVLGDRVIRPAMVRVAQ